MTPAHIPNSATCPCDACARELEALLSTAHPCPDCGRRVYLRLGTRRDGDGWPHECGASPAKEEP